jgi:hypothetical protein
MQKQLQSMAKKVKLPLSPKRQAILVLGMHRSGTSMFGGVINALGAAGPKTFMPGNFDNPRGYFESLPLATAHDEMLASAGSCWHDWRQLNPRWINSKAAEQHRQKIKALLIDEFGDEPLIFIKDPRICRFVPFMSSILAELNISPVAFLPVRNPLEVAYSLKRRDGFALPKSLLLWLRHVLEAEYHSRHMPRYFLQHERLLIDWRYHMDRAAEKTGVMWPACSDRADVKIEQFLAMDLHHERSTLEDMQNHPSITSMVRATYDILTAIVADGENKDLLDQLDLVRTKFDEGCEIFGAAVAAEELAGEQLRGELSTRNAEMEQLRQENSKLAASSEHQSLKVRDLAAERKGLARAHNDLIAERDGLARAHDDLIAERDALARTHNDLIAERDGLARAHDDLIAEHDALARAHDDLIAERDGLARAHNDLIAERDGLARAHNDLIAEHDALARAHDDLIAERDALARTHRDLIVERDALVHDRDGVVGERNALLASRSWRLTAPLRRMRRPFARQP